MNPKLRPQYTTIVLPEEYDIEKEMLQAVAYANHCCSPNVEVDVGKLVGLYCAYMHLCRIVSKPEEPNSFHIDLREDYDNRDWESVDSDLPDEND